MEITAIDGHRARCQSKGITREVDLFLLADQTLKVGDFVMVHVGHAIQRIDASEARTRWQLFDDMERLAMEKLADA